MSNNTEYSAHLDQPHQADIHTLNPRHSVLMRTGRYWLCGGIGLMAVSFGINMFFHNDAASVITTMYALTTLGSICLMKGLWDIFN